VIIIQYQNESEVQPIIDKQRELGFHLIAVSNVIEGHFLGFDDRDAVPPTTQPTNQEVMDYQKKVLDGQIVLMDVIATMYEDMAVKGTV